MDKILRVPHTTSSIHVLLVWIKAIYVNNLNEFDLFLSPFEVKIEKKKKFNKKTS